MNFCQPIAFIMCMTVLGGSVCLAQEASDPTPVIPVGFDAYRMWEKWPHQRIGARAYMRSTYDRDGGNRGADASHYLYQEREDFNVALDVEGKGVLYFKRTNHWHGSPWHYEIDNEDFIVKETTTADPTKKLKNATFIPQNLFPEPLVYTYATTKGADLMWRPIPFEDRLRIAYSRTYYGTGYYIWHQFVEGANLSQPIESWDKQPPPTDVMELLEKAGTDIAPRAGEQGVEEKTGSLNIAAGKAGEMITLEGKQTIRALKFSVPRDQVTNLTYARLRITWDGREHASVDAPIALFFGTGTLHNPEDKKQLVKAFPVNITYEDDRVHFACYFPMPFFKSAKIELVGDEKQNELAGTLHVISDVQWSVRTMPLNDPAHHVTYFHANYVDHKVPELGEDLVLLDTTKVEGGGDWSGNFIGTTFIFSKRGELRTLEADPRFFFDDSQTPQAYGTGTEEWGGGGDYWGGQTMTLPLAGHPVGVSSRNGFDHATSDDDLINSAYRFLLADLMPFGKRAVIRLEHGGINEYVEHYETVTYWYGIDSPTLVKTDELNIGDAESEKAHAYRAPEASEPYEIESRYELGMDTLRAFPPYTKTPYSEPADYAEYEFEAPAGKYFIYLRGKSDGGQRTDAVWIQFDKLIGTQRHGIGHYNRQMKGFGNWRDAAGAGQWSWSSNIPGEAPFFVLLQEDGKHRLRIQARDPGHEIDQILLSTQSDAPEGAEALSPDSLKEGQILIEMGSPAKKAGSFDVIEAEGAANGKALAVRMTEEGEEKTITTYPTEKKVGRTHTAQSEFTVKIREDNLGVMLRRTLDYQHPNQRAKVYIAAGDGQTPHWQLAGVWYLAGANTCYYSWPKGELAPTSPKLITSNRRFRDDEFLIPRNLTAGKSSIRVKIEFAPREKELMPGTPFPHETKWSEIQYEAYSFILPDVKAE